MIWIHVREDTLAEAHVKALKRLHVYGEVVDAPDWNTRRKEIALIQEVRTPLTDPMVSFSIPCGARELEAYIDEVCEGTMDHYVPEKLPYTYHDRMSSQIDYVCDELLRNSASTRACIVIRRPEDVMLKDQPCLSFIQYMIREDQLHTIATFRSNDAMKASAMNDIALVKLSDLIRDRLNVAMGTYTKIAHSYHAYERDWIRLGKIYGRPIESVGFDTFIKEF